MVVYSAFITIFLLLRISLLHILKKYTYKNNTFHYKTNLNLERKIISRLQLLYFVNGDISYIFQPHRLFQAKNYTFWNTHRTINIFFSSFKVLNFCPRLYALKWYLRTVMCLQSFFKLIYQSGFCVITFSQLEYFSLVDLKSCRNVNPCCRF